MRCILLKKGSGIKPGTVQVLVKWLLAVPHLIIVALLVDVTVSSSRQQNGWASWGAWGLITILALVAAVMLAFSGKYPRGLFDLLMGLNRWVYRVWVYMMLMTDEYPPFRLDRGGDDPTTRRPRRTRRGCDKIDLDLMAATGIDDTGSTLAHNMHVRSCLVDRPPSELPNGNR